MTLIHDTAEWNHFLLWEPSGETPEGVGIRRFQGPAEVDRDALSLLGKLVSAPRSWRLEADSAVTHRQTTGEEWQGHPSTADFCVLTYLVIEGSPEDVTSLREEIDWSCLDRYEVAEEGRPDLDAYTTSTVMGIAGAPATAVLFWARKADPSALPEMPIELMIDLVKTMNEWGRSLKERGLLLDSARLNVRVGGRQIVRGEDIDQRGADGCLLALGSFPSSQSPAQALEGSGLDPDRYVLEIATSNPWWAPVSDAPEYYDDPRNAILV